MTTDGTDGKQALSAEATDGVKGMILCKRCSGLAHGHLFVTGRRTREDIGQVEDDLTS